MSFCSADTLTYERGFLRCARRNNSRPGRASQFWRYCVLRSGRTLGGPSKRLPSTDVGSRDAPCRRRALSPGPYRRVFSSAPSPRPTISSPAAPARHRRQATSPAHIAEPESGTSPKPCCASTTGHGRACCAARHCPPGRRHRPARGNVATISPKPQRLSKPDSSGSVTTYGGPRCGYRPATSWGTPVRRGTSLNVIAEPKGFDPTQATRGDRRTPGHRAGRARRRRQRLRNRRHAAAGRNGEPTASSAPGAVHRLRCRGATWQR